MTTTVRHYADLDLRGSMIFSKDLSVFPASPRLGEQVLKEGVLWMWTAVQGITTWFPLTNKKNSYVHTQGVASTAWTVEHDLGSSDVIYAVYDNNGSPMYPSNLTSITANSFIMQFSEAVTGRVVVFAEAETFVPAVNSSAVNTALLNIASGVVVADVNGLRVGGADVATLDGTGKVPSSQLPSYVDDVLEVANFAALPATGETGKIYVTLNDNSQYRWGGTEYFQLTSSPGSTDAIPEGSVNLYFTTGRAAAAAPVQSVGGRTGDVILTVSDVTDLATVAISGSYTDLLNKPTIPSAYNLPVATPSVLGGVKQGSNVAIAGDGTLTVPNLSGSNTGDETTATIKTALGITTLSGSNTGDETNASVKALLGITTLSGSNTGDETGATIRTKLGVTTLNGDNTGDETTATIKSKLSITTLSGSNTGDNATNSQYANDYRAANFVAGTDYIAPGGALGTPSSGVATNLTGTASGLTAGATTALATTRTIGGSSFNGTANVTSFPVPGPIGGTTPSTGAFTQVLATSDTQTGYDSAALEARSNSGNVYVSLHAAGVSAAAIRHVRSGNGVEIVDATGALANFAAAAGAFTTLSATGNVTGSNLSGTNTGDNATNSQYANDYRAGNFVAGTNYLAPGGALGTPSSGNLSSCTVDGTNAVGFKGVPQNIQSAAYTLVLTDAGKHILHPSADTTARIFTIPANGSVAFPIGTAVTFVNQNAGGVITIAITTDTMRLAGAGTTGSRTLAANGIATAVKLTATEWIISGVSLT